MTRRSAVILATALPAVGGLAVAQRRGVFRSRDSELPVAKDEAEKKILGVLSEAMRTGDVYLEVPTSDGRMLRLLTEAVGAKVVVEIGTSTGYSGLWLLLALKSTSGKLTTFEIDRGRAAQARKHFAQAGVDQKVTVVEGDAHENVKRLKEPIDVLFIDADKDGYADYLNRLLPLIRPGGLILAHNFDQASEYGRVVRANPELETLVPGGSLAITLRKR
jgi:caffeoyl-CoA O-methyltransferase